MMTITPNKTPINVKKKHPSKPKFRQETRLGLVLYGGVSLAVYMNGICREFYNAMRGRGIYKLIKALTDSDIVVDIVSGTSAGGINGVLLSYAIANSYTDTVVDFEEFANIWRESGDISKLLRDVKPNKNGTNSVLNGEGYYQEQLFNAFKKAGNNSKKAPEGEWHSDFKELDLFITGTDILGRTYKTFDNTGKVIEIKDHRAVFHLKYREDQDLGDPFSLKDCDTQQALAKLCRITSCFPVAFPVVTVKLDRLNKQNKDNEEKIDKKLEAWGNLLKNRILPIKEPLDGYQLHFVDGGVLDNRPFSYTTQAIYYRTANRPVNRQLFYLDPNPETFVGSSTFNEMKQPNIWKVIKDSLISLPSYESIGKDLQEIKDRNDKIRRYNFLLKSVDVDEAISQSEQKIEERNRYLRCRLVGLKDRVLPFLFDNQHPVNEEHKQEELLEKCATLLTQSITDQEEIKQREKILNKVAKDIEHLDFYYVVRKHDFLLQQIYDLMYSSRSNSEQSKIDEEQYKALQDLASQISWLLELIKVIGEALREMLKLEPVRQGFYKLINVEQIDGKARNESRKQIYEYLLMLFRFLLKLDVDAQILEDFKDEDKPQIIQIIFKEIPNKLTEKSNQLTLDNCESMLVKIKGGNELEEDKSNKSIFEVIQQASLNLIKSSQVAEKDQLSKKFENFEQIDQIIYAYEYLSDIQGKDLIRLVRISPNDADKGLGKGKGLDEKLAGDQFRAFGGFFKKSWRSNDILWGRLDGLNRIVDGLLTPEALKSFSGFVERQCVDLKIEKVDYLKLLVDESFPAVPEGEKNALIDDYLMKLTQPKQLSNKELQDFLEQLVSLGHRAIIKEDLGNVLEDAITEQVQWNYQLIKPKENLEQVLQELDDKEVLDKTNKQLIAIRKLNKLVKIMVTPKLYRKVSALIQGLDDSQGQKPSKSENEKLKDLMKNAFLETDESEHESLIQYPLEFLDFVRNKSDLDKLYKVDELYKFLNRLLYACKSECKLKQDKLKEEKKSQETIAIDKNIQVLEQILKSKYSPVLGYFDRAVTPFAAQELAKTSVKELRDKGREEDYFRYDYRVGSEKLADDIPLLVRENLLAQIGLILRNIFNSPPTRDFVNKTTTFQIVDRLLQSFYVWVQFKKPKNRLLPELLHSLVSLLLPIVAIISVVYVLGKLPVWLLVLVIMLIVLQYFNKVFNRGKLPTWLLWVAVIVLAAVVGSYFLPDSISTIPFPFVKIKISIDSLIR